MAEIAEPVADHISGMDAGQRQAAARRAEALAQILRGLQSATPDPAERLRMARHFAAVTPGLGIRPADIGPADVTDQGLAGHIASVAEVGHRVSPQQAARYLGPLRASDPPTNPQGAVRYLGPAV